MWGVVSENDVDCKLFFNLPNGSYTNQEEALADGDNTLDYTIPVEYLGAGFLITKLTVKRKNSDVTIIEGGTIDLRGSIPAVGGGSIVGGTGITTFDELTDTPINKVGASLQGVRVNFEETALEYYDILDNDATNEYNTSVALVGNDLQVTDGGGTLSTNLAVYLDNTDNQTIDVSQLVGTDLQLSLSNDGEATKIIDLSTLDDNGTDNQDLTLVGNTLAISNDPNTDVDLTPYLDNTDAQDLTLVGNTLAITGDPTAAVDLSGYLDNTDTQNPFQTISKVGQTVTLSDGGGTFTDDVDDADSDPTNEIQTLSIIDDELSISGSAPTIDLLPYLDNTDTQDLTLVGNTLAISNDPIRM